MSGHYCRLEQLESHPHISVLLPTLAELVYLVLNWDTSEQHTADKRNHPIIHADISELDTGLVVSDLTLHLPFLFSHLEGLAVTLQACL